MELRAEIESDTCRERQRHTGRSTRNTDRETDVELQAEIESDTCRERQGHAGR